MGSLLPGWDERSPGMPPKEFQDFNENEDEDLGYFAAYAKLKKLQKEGAEPSSPIAITHRSASLSSRRSLTGDTRASPRTTSLSRASLPTGALGREWPMSPQGARSLSRAETMAPGYSAGSHAGTGFGGPAEGLHRMYSMPMTRGERTDILAGLVLPTSPSAVSSGTPHTPSLDAYRTHAADKDKEDYQWWRHLDSSALNERPDEPVSKEKGFTPQYGVTGQGIHFHEAAEGPSFIHAH